jgi:hypothetical protein
MAIVKWLQGKKTYIGAAVIAIAVIVGFFYGVVSADSLAIGLGAAISVAGMAAKTERYLSAGVAILTDIKGRQYSAAATEAVGIAAQASGSTS